MRSLRCQRCGRIALDLWRVRLGGTREKALCPGCCADLRALGVKVDVIR